MNGYFARVTGCSGTTSDERGSYSSIDMVGAQAAQAAASRASGIIVLSRFRFPTSSLSLRFKITTSPRVVQERHQVDQLRCGEPAREPVGHARDRVRAQLRHLASRNADRRAVRGHQDERRRRIAMNVAIELGAARRE